MNFVEKVIERFEKKKPLAVMSRMLVANTLTASRLDDIFARNSQQQVSGMLAFSTVADIMGEVVLQVHPSVNAAYVDRSLSISVNSVYNKLQGVETQVSRGVVQETAERMRNIIRQLGGTAEPLLPGYRTKIVDGNHLRRTDSRIGELRKRNVAPLPGKSLVVYDAEYRLAVDVLPCECGHASERSLLPSLLETVEVKDLWIADRNFCTVAFLFGIAKRKAKFIIRQHGQMPYSLKGRRRRIGETETGIVYEQTMEVVDEQGNMRSFRRISISLYEPTRDGDREVHVVTNLPKRICATQIADLYRERWTIETAFQNMAENLEGEIQTLGYPKAALFGFCMALVSYNVFSVIRATVQSVHGKDAADNFSFYYMSNEIAASHDGMSVVLDDDFWRDRYANKTPRQIATELERIAKNIRLTKYKKNKWTPKNKAKPKKNKTNRQHASTFKVLQEARKSA